MTRRIRLLCLFLALLPIGAAGQSLHTEQGRPYYVERFSAQDYGAHDQNWAVVQDGRGVIYVANWTGLLEYDGRTWRNIPFPAQFARSLTADPSGQVYVGGIGEMGFLAPDSMGRIGYHSLLSHLPEADRAFADIWTVHATDEGVYFQSFERIFRWNGEEMRVWKAKTRFHKAFAVDGTYYVRQDGMGLLEVQDEQLVLSPGGERFADVRIDVMLPFGEGSALLVTRTEGLLVKRGARIEPFATEADAYLRGERVYHGAILSDSTYALTTFSGTVVLMDRDGRVLRVLGEDEGLQSDEYVLYVYPDWQGGLWLALDTGLMRVDAPTPLTAFGQNLGLAGTVYNVQRFDGSLYAATSQGLFRLQPAEPRDGLLDRRARFVSVGDLRQQVWSVLAAKGRLLAAANDGVYEISGGRARLVLPGRSLALTQSAENPSLLYVGLKEGLALLAFQGGRWEASSHSTGLDVGEVRSIVEDEDGSLWLGTLFNGVTRIWIEKGHLLRSEQYGEQEGLPAGAVFTYKRDNKPLFIAPAGVYRVQKVEGQARFMPDAAINNIVEPDGEEFFLINTNQPDRLWFVKNDRLYIVARMADGGYEDVTPPILHLEGVSYEFLYVEESGVGWVAGNQGLLRYDPSVEKDYAVPYPALVRRVAAGQDSLVFGGVASPGYEAPEIAHESNNLHFTFSASSFNAPEKTEYQVWLEGFDEGWSRWTTDTRKEYTNLPHQDYRFHVRARNAQGVISQEGVYTFEVLPPWYLTWWAYSLYLLIAIGIVWGYSDFRLREHRRMLAHEQAVNRRLDTANARLREANERLHQADKLKDDFLANTSHELRTPLTAILGFAAVLQEELEGELRSFAAMIQRGGERLLETVNGLLDMARLQADLIDIQPVDLDVIEDAREIVRALEPLANEKGLFLKVLPETSALPARMDRSCLERILVNLVGNAIKFTQEGGITVLIDAGEEEVYLIVRDTGIGIHDEFLPELFEEFQQESTGYGRTHEGTGLGLAIIRRIVHELGGEINVESRVGGGTTFRVTLPRYDRHEYATSDGEKDALPSLPEDTRLLLIEDPDRPQARLRHVLEPQCRIDAVVGAEEGLAAAQRTTYDGFLIDGHLKPLPSGQPMLDALRVLPDYAETPAVAVTGFAMPGDRERFIRAGYTDHIGKPFTGRRLLLLLESVLGTRPMVEVERPARA